MTAESDEFGGAVANGPRLGSRAPAFVRRSPVLYPVWRAGIFLVGLAVVAGGVVLLPLPGPGWVVIFGGMAIWATEFAWAQKVLHWAKRKAAAAAKAALDPRVRRRNLLAAAGLVVLSGLAGWYVYAFGLAVPWAAG